MSSLLFLLLCVVAVTGQSTYENPVIGGGDWPDPGVVYSASDHLYYAATTGCNAPTNYFPIHSSPDLGSWTQSGYVFNETTWPRWATGNVICWAPEIHFIPSSGKYVVYYVTAVNGVLCIGAGESSNGPLGPFIDTRGSPLVQAPKGSCFGAIDPTFYTENGQNWVIFKEDGNSCGQPTNIYAAQLDSTGMKIVGEPIFLITNEPSSWEATITEAPWMMRNGTFLYLFYSGAYYNQPSYAVGVARAQNMTTPFQKYGLNPILHSAPGAGSKGSTKHFGPGHCSVLAVPPSSPTEWAIVYAAEDPSGNQRNMMLDTIHWTQDDWPVVGVPSDTPQPIPGGGP